MSWERKNIILIGKSLVIGVFAFLFLLNWLLSLLGTSIPGIVRGIGHLIAFPFKLFFGGTKNKKKKGKSDKSENDK